LGDDGKVAAAMEVVLELREERRRAGMVAARIR
jgi:hypothetical protein